MYWESVGNCFYVDHKGKGKSVTCEKEKKGEKPNSVIGALVVSGKGVHEWVIDIQKLAYQSYVCVGLTTKLLNENRDAFGKKEALSYGYCCDGTILNGKFEKKYPSEETIALNEQHIDAISRIGFNLSDAMSVSEYDEGSTVSVLLDLDHGLISFKQNDVHLGVAFEDIDTDLEWRLVVSMTTIKGNRIKLQGYKEHGSVKSADEKVYSPKITKKKRGISGSLTLLNVNNSMPLKAKSLDGMKDEKEDKDMKKNKIKNKKKNVSTFKMDGKNRPKSSTHRTSKGVTSKIHRKSNSIFSIEDEAKKKKKKNKSKKSRGNDDDDDESRGHKKKKKKNKKIRSRSSSMTGTESLLEGNGSEEEEEEEEEEGRGEEDDDLDEFDKYIAKRNKEEEEEEEDRSKGLKLSPVFQNKEKGGREMKSEDEEEEEEEESKSVGKSYSTPTTPTKERIVVVREKWKEEEEEEEEESKVLVRKRNSIVEDSTTTLVSDEHATTGKKTEEESGKLLESIMAQKVLMEKKSLEKKEGGGEVKDNFMSENVSVGKEEEVFFSSKKNHDEEVESKSRKSLSDEKVKEEEGEGRGEEFEKKSDDIGCELKLIENGMRRVVEKWDKRREKMSGKEFYCLQNEIQNFRKGMQVFEKRLGDIESYILCVYPTWNLDEMIEWISHLENGRYRVYLEVIRKGFLQDGILKGEQLTDVKASDLSVKPFEIRSFSDRKGLEKHFAALKNSL